MNNDALPTPAAPAAGTHRLLIKNMVCPQCVRVVREDLAALGLTVQRVALGEADVRTADGAEPHWPAIRSVLTVARAAAQAAGCRGQVALGPVTMEDGSALFNQNTLLSSAKARRVLGWVPRQPGLLTGIDRYYQDWKASQALEAW